jgi:hypothetical protein
MKGALADEESGTKTSPLPAFSLVTNFPPETEESMITGGLRGWSLPPLKKIGVLFGQQASARSAVALSLLIFESRVAVDLLEHDFLAQSIFGQDSSQWIA